MTCKHKTLEIETLETCGQTYHRDRQGDEWGDIYNQNIETIEMVRCSDCGTDLTDDEDLRNSIKW